MPFRHPPLALIAPIAIATLSLPAHAELSGPASGIQAEAARMGARVVSVSMGSYVRYDVTRPNGGLVHEFANAQGRVFAVTWSGPGKPDLRSLLGQHFAALQSGSRPAGHAMRAWRRPAQVADSDLQIQTGGHMGWFRGVAYRPSLAPTGFATADLTQEN